MKYRPSRNSMGFDVPGRRLSTRRTAFTLVELLVVISIIALLIALLMPALSKSREVTRDIKCKAQQHALGIGFVSFAHEHENRLPGVFGLGAHYHSSPKWHDSWLATAPHGFPGAPHTGTIFPYVNREFSLYLCPSLETKFGAGKGYSNGHFDYATFPGFGGARLENIRGDSYLRIKNRPFFPTPWLVEEFGANINGGHMEEGHSTGDRMGAWHSFRTNYLSPDGSVHAIKSPNKTAPTMGPVSAQWKASTNSGKVRWLHNGNAAGTQGRWGTWD